MGYDALPTNRIAQGLRWGMGVRAVERYLAYDALSGAMLAPRWAQVKARWSISPCVTGTR